MSTSYTISNVPAAALQDHFGESFFGGATLEDLISVRAIDTPSANLLSHNLEAELPRRTVVLTKVDFAKARRLDIPANSNIKSLLAKRINAFTGSSYYSTYINHDFDAIVENLLETGHLVIFPDRSAQLYETDEMYAALAA